VRVRVAAPLHSSHATALTPTLSRCAGEGTYRLTPRAILHTCPQPHAQRRTPRGIPSPGSADLRPLWSARAPAESAAPGRSRSDR
jgi:hypothetical protein